jgi:hypothetical protein
MSTDKHPDHANTSMTPSQFWRHLPEGVHGPLVTALGSIVVALIPILAGYVHFGKDDKADHPTSSVTETATVTVTPNLRAPLSTGAPAASADSADTTYLMNLNPANESSDISSPEWQDGPVVINGHTYSQGMKVIDDGPDCAASREYALSGKYSRFRAMIGFDDNTQDATPIVIKITVDNNVVRSVPVVLKKPYSLDLDVKGAVRLGLSIDTKCDTVAPALGDPRLEG